MCYITYVEYDEFIVKKYWKIQVNKIKHIFHIILRVLLSLCFLKNIAMLNDITSITVCINNLHKYTVDHMPTLCKLIEWYVFDVLKSVPLICMYIVTLNHSKLSSNEHQLHILGTKANVSEIYKDMQLQLNNNILTILVYFFRHAVSLCQYYFTGLFRALWKRNPKI